MQNNKRKEGAESELKTSLKMVGQVPTKAFIYSCWHDVMKLMDPLE